MAKDEVNKAYDVAQAAKSFEQQRTGHAPKSVTVVMSDDVLVIRLHGVLSEAEKVLAQSQEGVEQVQEFHRRLFAIAAGSLRNDIEGIMGVKVQQANANIEPGSAMVVEAFSSGTVVQVFLLSGRVETCVWSDDEDSAKQ